MFRDFIVGATTYLDPAQLHALAHVSRLTAEVVRERCSRHDIDPAIQQEVSDYVHGQFKDMSDVIPESPPIRDMRLSVFEQRMTRALSRSSVTMFATRHSIYLSDVPEQLAEQHAADSLTKVILLAACIRDDFALAQVALDRLAATHYMERLETPPSELHMMGDIAPVAYPAVSDSHHRYIRWHRGMCNKTPHGRIFAYLASHGFLTMRDIMCSISVADDVGAARALLANGYHFTPYDMPISDRLVEIVKHDREFVRLLPYISRDHVIFEDDQRFCRTTFRDLMHSANTDDVSICERVIAQSQEYYEGQNTFDLLEIVFTQHRLDLKPLLMARIGAHTQLPVHHMYSIAADHSLDVRIQVMELWMSDMIERDKRFSKQGLHHFAFLVYSCMEWPGWSAWRVRALICQSGARQFLNKLHQRHNRGRKAIYPNTDYHHVDRFYISNIEQYNLCRDLRISINWQDVAPFVVEALSRYGLREIERIIADMPIASASDAEYIADEFIRCKRAILPSCRDFFAQHVLGKVDDATSQQLRNAVMWDKK